MVNSLYTNRFFALGKFTVIIQYGVHVFIVGMSDSSFGYDILHLDLSIGKY